MIEYGQDIASNSELTTEVCIVGTGAAGITLAWHLQAAGKKVILIDGSRDFDNQPSMIYVDKERLYAGEVAGQFAVSEPEFLILPTYQQSSPKERERYFGGTTTHWGGQCRPLAPLAFEGRQGFGPDWPITRTDLDPYYALAVPFCELVADGEQDTFSAEYWAKVLGADVPRLPGFEVFMYQFIASQNLNFANKTFRGQTLADSQAITVIRNASLLEIDHQGGSVGRLRVASMTMDEPAKPATEFFIRADAYVLATGAVENARLLLLSDAGNGQGLVGVGFMAHPLSAYAITSVGNYLTGAQQRLLNGQQSNGSQWRSAGGVTVAGRLVANEELCKEYAMGRAWMRTPGTYGAYFETAPGPNSRISLSEQRDPVFGQRQSLATWELGDTDQRTYEQTVTLFDQAIKSVDPNGYASCNPWSTVLSNANINGHHIGTTRMSAKPEDGVVDANLRAHELSNLYVAGSSVYPTAASRTRPSRSSRSRFGSPIISAGCCDWFARAFGGRIWA